MKKVNVDSLFDIGFVIPLEEEAKPLINILEKKKVFQIGLRKVVAGYSGEKRVCVTVSGCGKIKSVPATQMLIDRYPSKIYIHYGTAGALSNRLKIGDIILAREIIEHDVVELFPTPVPPPSHIIDDDLLKFFMGLNDAQIVIGRILSGDEDVIAHGRKLELATQFEGLSVDWESAGFALTCRVYQVRHLVFRAISDLAHEQIGMEYQQNQAFAVEQAVGFIVDKVLDV